MKFYILASLILFCLCIGHAIRKGRKADKKVLESFWDRETKANEVRKKSIEGLDYVPIPGFIPEILSKKQGTVFEESLEIVNSLCNSRLVNLSDYSNTDLKLMYGAANLTRLSEYDQNYALFIRTLDRAAGAMIEDGESQDDARQLWEYALHIGSDITSTYMGLAKIYAKKEPDRLQDLYCAAKLLSSGKRNIILHKLEEFEKSIG